LGNSRAPNAFSELKKIADKNRDLPSGKLAWLVIKLWDHQLRTFVLSEPREVITSPNYATNAPGLWSFKITVKPNGTVKNAIVTLRGSSHDEAAEIIRHQLYCPANNGKTYFEAELSYNYWACGL
jgi:hypothetical protein